MHIQNVTKYTIHSCGGKTHLSHQNISSTDGWGLESQTYYELIIQILWKGSVGLTGQIIRPQFCTYHDSSAVVACAKLWPDRIDRNEYHRMNFPEISIMSSLTVHETTPGAIMPVLPQESDVKPFKQWEGSFQWKLPSHWLKSLRPCHVTVVITSPIITPGRHLTHWGRDKMAAVSQTTLS